MRILARGTLGGGEVPAEVSKRGVMIDFNEGALSSRPKRAAIIIPKPKNNASKKHKNKHIFSGGGCHDRSL
jgi:hypothetical protein